MTWWWWCGGGGESDQQDGDEDRVDGDSAVGGGESVGSDCHGPSPIGVERTGSTMLGEKKREVKLLPDEVDHQPGGRRLRMRMTTKNCDKTRNKPPTKNKTQRRAMTGQGDPASSIEENKKVAFAQLKTSEVVKERAEDKTRTSFEDLRKKWQGIAPPISKELEEVKKIRKLREKFENNDKTLIKTKKRPGKENTIGEMFTRMERRTASSSHSVQEGWKSGKKRQREEDDEKKMMRRKRSWT